MSRRLLPCCYLAHYMRSGVKENFWKEDLSLPAAFFQFCIWKDLSNKPKISFKMQISSQNLWPVVDPVPVNSWPSFLLCAKMYRSKHIYICTHTEACMHVHTKQSESNSEGEGERKINWYISQSINQPPTQWQPTIFFKEETAGWVCPLPD